MHLARAVLWLLACGFAGFGGAYAVRPTAMAALTDILLPTAAARIDFAATYGGLQLGFAIFLGLCAGRRHPTWVLAGLLAGGWVLLGIAVSRMIGVWSSGGAGPVIFEGLAIELTGMALAFWAARRVATHGPTAES